jgi:hypothetical protein
LALVLGKENDGEALFMFLACRLADAPILGRGQEKLVDAVRFIGSQPDRQRLAAEAMDLLAGMDW